MLISMHVKRLLCHYVHYYCCSGGGVANTAEGAKVFIGKNNVCVNEVALYSVNNGILYNCVAGANLTSLFLLFRWR